MIPLSPRTILAGGAVLGLLATNGCSYVKGRGDGSASVQAKYAAATEKALQAMRRGAAAIDTINGNYAAARNRQDGAQRSIRDAASFILPRPIYASTCVDADGVGLLDRARAAGNLSLDTGEPAGAAP